MPSRDTHHTHAVPFLPFLRIPVHTGHTHSPHTHPHCLLFFAHISVFCREFLVSFWFPTHRHSSSGSICEGYLHCPEEDPLLRSLHWILLPLPFHPLHEPCVGVWGHPSYTSVTEMFLFSVCCWKSLWFFHACSHTAPSDPPSISLSLVSTHTAGMPNLFCAHTQWLRFTRTALALRFRAFTPASLNEHRFIRETGFCYWIFREE